VVQALQCKAASGVLYGSDHVPLTALEAVDLLHTHKNNPALFIDAEDLNRLCHPTLMRDRIVKVLHSGHSYVGHLILKQGAIDASRAAWFTARIEGVHNAINTLVGEITNNWNYPTARMGRLAVEKLLTMMAEDAEGAEKDSRGSLLAQVLEHLAKQVNQIPLILNPDEGEPK